MRAEAALFKALCDPIRLRLMVLLAVNGETCVCDLSRALGEADYKVSRHLGILRAGGLVATRRSGAWIYYQLERSRNEMENCLHDCFRDCLVHEPVAREDLARLRKAACETDGSGRASSTHPSHSGNRRQMAPAGS